MVVTSFKIDSNVQLKMAFYTKCALKRD